MKTEKRKKLNIIMMSSGTYGNKANLADNCLIYQLVEAVHLETAKQVNMIISISVYKCRHVYVFFVFP